MTADLLDSRARETTWHEALFYRTNDEYVAGVQAFVDGALDAGQPVLLALPRPHVALMAEAMAGVVDGVRLADMTEIGRNPNRIIPTIQRFLDEYPGQPVSFVGEPIWPGRTEAEIAEATRHEALINHAFADSDAAVLCPYDVGRLAPTVVADASRTHPVVVEGSRRQSSDRYQDPVSVWADVAHLPAPPADAETLAIHAGSLSDLRRAARRLARRAGVAGLRADDLLVAVTELATNSLVHARGAGTLTLWTEPGAVVGEVRDAGLLADPMAGRRQPPADLLGGRGLWMVNHLCDLVQLHSDESGTVVRVRVHAA